MPEMASAREMAAVAGEIFTKVFHIGVAKLRALLAEKSI